MADMLQELLSSAPSRGGASPELLESLGRKAARAFIDNGASLNDSIAAMSSEYPDLDNEHIKRIAEFANNSVFQELHSDSEDKNVHFDVADPGVVIRDLKDGGSPAHDGKTLHNSDYQDEGKERPDLNAFSEAFQEHGKQTTETEQEKLGAASSHHEHADPVEDVFDAHLRLRGSREKVAEAHEAFDLIRKQAEEDFYQSCKREVLDPDGFGIRGVVEAVKLASPSDSIAFQALRKVANRLVKEGALSAEDMSKTAGEMKVVNPEHPVVLSFLGLVKAAGEKVRAREALEEVNDGLDQTSSFLRGLR
jgi:hypothetical protein